MARGNSIIVTPNPKGRFLEGVISGTPKPGTVMEISAVDSDTGDKTFRVYQPGTDGERRPMFVLLDDPDQGHTSTTAYVSGERCFVYEPLPGDELNMIVQDVSVGTADSYSALDMLMVDTGTGTLIASNGTAEAEPFQLLEDITQQAADALSWCLFTGY